MNFWDIFRKLLGLPTKADEYTYIGTEFIAEGKYSHAKKTFELALEIDPDHEWACKNLKLAEMFLEIETKEQEKFCEN